MTCPDGSTLRIALGGDRTSGDECAGADPGLVLWPLLALGVFWKRARRRGSSGVRWSP
jgi:hypothetical protein